MKEYMLLIRNTIDHQASWSPAQHEKFLQKCEVYIEGLKKLGKLIAAQPLAKQGRVISGSAGAWKDASLTPTGEVQVGYYHILANDIDEAIRLAKGNPEFEFGSTAKIEVRPIKTEEENTGFVYPKGK
jgi:hypothetical protein